MSIKEIVFKHEALALKAWSLESTVVALNEALFRGEYDASTYEGAFFQLIHSASELSHDAREFIDDLFAALHEMEDKL